MISSLLGSNDTKPSLSYEHHSPCVGRGSFERPSHVVSRIGSMGTDASRTCASAGFSFVRDIIYYRSVLQMCTRRKHTTVTKENGKEILVTVNARLTLRFSLGRASGHAKRRLLHMRRQTTAVAVRQLANCSEQEEPDRRRRDSSKSIGRENREREGKTIEPTHTI